MNVFLYSVAALFFISGLFQFALIRHMRKNKMRLPRGK